MDMRGFQQRFFYLGLLIWSLIFPCVVPALDSSTFAPALKIQAVACGAGHSLILLNDGTVWGCGANEHGQLGDNTGVYHRIPVKIPGIVAVKAIACGPHFSLALKKDGTVWGWGSSDNGFPGTGKVPGKIPGLKNITLLACGAGQAFAVKKDGTVWGWGFNSFGQLGDGTCRDHKRPFRIKGLMQIKTVACGTRHAAAVQTDGTLWAWGSNASGQLGDGTRAARLKPVPVRGISQVVEAVCGPEYTIALKKDGSVWSWGANGSGQLGDGSKTEKIRPVLVAGLEGITAIAGGLNFNLALQKNGTLWGWGSDVFGELGDVKALESVAECIPCGGKNNVYYYDKPKPVPVTEGAGVAMIACGASFAMMVKKNGSVWSWGVNHCGQLADGSVIDRLAPAQNYYGRITGKMAVQYQNISAGEARARLDQEKDLYLLDVRTPEEYQQKRLRNSRLIPVKQLEREAETKIPDKNTPILVYCKAGLRSVKAADILTRLGYQNVSNLMKGIDGWPYETVSGEP
jgi:alpha-tubulin suppressor-like RCC1 family protein